MSRILGGKNSFYNLEKKSLNFYLEIYEEFSEYTLKTK